MEQGKDIPSLCGRLDNVITVPVETYDWPSRTSPSGNASLGGVIGPSAKRKPTMGAARQRRTERVGLFALLISYVRWMGRDKRSLFDSPGIEERAARAGAFLREGQ